MVLLTTISAQGLENDAATARPSRRPEAPTPAIVGTTFKSLKMRRIR